MEVTCCLALPLWLAYRLCIAILQALGFNIKP